jgi:TolB protein
MATKFTLILIIIAGLCVACQPITSPDDQATIPTQENTPYPTTTATSTVAPTVPPSATPVPVQEDTSSVNDSIDGIVAFYSDRDGNPEIYTMNADGSGAVRLTNDPAFDDSPAISPDGTQIAFLTARHDPSPSFPDLKYEIYVMGIDGSHPRRLTETDAAEDHPAWSPDGNRIIFDADYDGDGFYELYTMNADGTDGTRLTSNAANDQFADWSPDGTQIAFSSDRNGNWDIFVMDADGSNQQALTDNPNWELFPAWSPDGTQIAFTGLAPRSRNTDVFVMNADGSDVRQLTDSPRFDENPVWSPDGSLIAFQTERDGNFEIYVMSPDGNNQRPLAAYPADELWPSWESSTSPATALSLEKSAQQFPSRGTFQAGLGDLDGDGDLDAVFANPLTHNSAVWLNDGGVQGGTPGTFTDTGQKLTQYGHGVGVADLDGDGDLDAVIACHQFRTPSKVYLNDGAGILQETQDLGDGAISGAELNLLDLNGDGYIDVHIMYYAPDGVPDKVYLNDGHATFTDSGLALDEETIAWGDLDGDGDTDYFGKRWGVGYTVMLNDGGVQGRTPGQFSAGWQMDDTQSTLGSIALADFDGDGDLDALVTNGFQDTGSFPSRLFWNDGGQFTDSGQILNPTLAAEVTAGDLDGDGDPDVVVANMDLPDEIWLNDGGIQEGTPGHFTDSGLRLGDQNHMSTKPSLGDLDGDLNLFIGSLNGAPEIWFNTAE